MPTEQMTFGQLEDSLTALGYEGVTTPTHRLYRKAGRLPMMLPVLRREQAVPGMSLGLVEHTLMADGVIHRETASLASMLARAVEDSTTKRTRTRKTAKRSPPGSAIEGLPIATPPETREIAPRPRRAERASAETARKPR